MNSTSVTKSPEFPASNFEFTNALSQELGRTGMEGNMIFSPLSLALTLLAVRYAAQGHTAKEIDRAMGLPGKQPDADFSLPKSYEELLNTTKPMLNPSFKFRVDSKMFVRDDVNIYKRFRNKLRTQLGTRLQTLDFNDVQNATETINDWVFNKTEGKTGKLFSPDSIDNKTMLLLANVVYFKGSWENQFSRRRTHLATFHISSTQSTNVSMMVTTEDFPYGYLEQLDAKIVVLPYNGGRFSMHVYIPNDIDGLDNLIDSLQNATLEQIRKHLRTPRLCEEVVLRFPKFKIKSTWDLVEPLKKMGVAAMFSPGEADFSGMTDAPIFMSQFVQKAYIKVDEKGTEATAASGLKATVTCMKRRIDMHVDRPFHFQIIDEHNDLILFAGSVRNPNF